MILRLTLKGMTKDAFPIRIHAIRNDGGYAVFLAVKTDKAEYSDTAYGCFVEPEKKNDPGFWREILEESMKVVCNYYLINSYKYLNTPQEEYWAIRADEVERNMKLFPAAAFRSDKWEVVGWLDK